MEEIKVTDFIIKVHITSGNIKWRSFALRFCASNHKCAWQPLLPSAKGLSIYFYVESSPFLLKITRWRAHCRLHSLWLVYIGYDLTGSLLPWITLFSQSLIFKGALHLCFAVSERASEIPFWYVMLWLFWESVVIRVLLLSLASWLCYWYE